jgi:O-antigen/teichoic acid export membrane protein
VISLFTSNLTVIFLPKAALAIQSREGLRRFMLQMGLALLGIAILAGVGMVWSEPLLRLALGDQYAQAAGPLRLLLVSYVLTAVSGPLATILYAEGRTDLAFGERVVELAAVLVAGFILIPAHGANGAAAAIAISYLLGAVFVAAAVGRSVRIASRGASQ